jgi:hypothetical protein
MPAFIEKPLTYDETKGQTGLVIRYLPSSDGSVTIKAVKDDVGSLAEIIFTKARIDEAHILYIEVTELLHSRVALNQDRSIIQKAVQKLFALFRGEKVSFEDVSAPAPIRRPSGEFVPNPGKQIDIEVDGSVYQRLPVRTRIITLHDKDMLPILQEYVGPYLQPDDLLFISEKALTITQGGVVSMSDIKPVPLARFLARSVGNYYGSSDFRGFGHGTAIAMQLFLEEAGYVRVLFAAAVSAITRPLRIRGMFYRICGKRAKSVDCPMSFLILEYAHSAKLAPNKPSAEARRFKKALGPETIILDANYRGAFSLGKSSRAISESFIGKLFADNPLGQSDEMTPFCIVRKK